MGRRTSYLLWTALGIGAFAAACSGAPAHQSDSDAAPTADTGGEASTSTDQPQSLASLLILHFPGTDTEETAEFLSTFQPAGIILMPDDIPSPESDLAEQTRRWQTVARDAGLPDFLVSIDQEGAPVSRLEEDPAPAPAELVEADSREVEQAFKVRGEYLASLGINVNFGIVADVSDDPEAFIYERVLGHDAQQATAAVEAAVLGEQEGSAGQVASTLKHFPGHGMTDGDSHQVVTDCGEVTEQQWQESAALPFAAGIEAGSPLVMMSHVVCRSVSDDPASVSAAWYQILREEMGFTGTIVTDDMSMLVNTGEPEYADPVANAVAAINAGADLVISIGGDDQPAAREYASSLVSGLEEARADGSLDEERVQDALSKAGQLRESLTEASS